MLVSINNPDNCTKKMTPLSMAPIVAPLCIIPCVDSTQWYRRRHYIKQGLVRGCRERRRGF